MQSPNVSFQFHQSFKPCLLLGIKKESLGARDTADFREETQETTDSAVECSSLFPSPQTHLG